MERFSKKGKRFMSTPFSGQRRFNVSDIGKKITGVNYLSKFHFEIDLNKGNVNWRNIYSYIQKISLYHQGD